MKTTWIVTIGLVAICVVSLVVSNDQVAVGALAALAGWLGGNSNGKKEAQ